MRITNKILSLLLAVIMLCSAMTGMAALTTSAAGSSSSSDKEEGTVDPSTFESGEDALSYRMSEALASPDDMLAFMEAKYTKGNYTIYAYEKTGEVAIKDNVTGQVTFSNPYDVATSGSTNNIKKQLLSQLVVTYLDNGKETIYYSSEWAAELDQITVKNIRGGIRVEYTIGREQAKRLIPRWIEKSRFEEQILAPLQEYFATQEYGDFFYKQFYNFYSYKSLDNCVTDNEKNELMNTYPCTVKKEGTEYVKLMDIYVFDPTASEVQMNKREEDIKNGCPDYSYEQLDYDHSLTGYTSTDENPPVFKMALEYTINDDGFTVRLPANGIRFNQEKYTLQNVSVLPYMGAGNNNYTGYTFYPDGSGALFAFEDLADEDTYAVSGQMYGADYAYHTLSGGAYQQDIRYPVFGMVENTRYYDCLDAEGNVINRISGVVYDILNGELPSGIDEAKAEAIAAKYSLGDQQIEVSESRGYLAIVEEGDALAQLTYTHAGVVSPYDTVKMDFNPRPKDSYKLTDSISVGTTNEMTVVSSRKYVGSYRIRYIMLSDETVAAEKEQTQPETWTWYAAKWMGMAEAYRNYLIEKGVLTEMYKDVADSELQDIPLYIESFGATETIEKILSVPVTVQKALTSFEDVKTMYVNLLSQQVTNVNFKLTGFYNGGLYSSMPYKLKWEKVVSDETDFQELLNFAANISKGDYTEVKAYAKEVLDEDKANALIAYLDDEANQSAIRASLDIFPDFEFSYTNGDEWFDGLSLSKHAVKTIDNRYTSKRMYSATQQKYIGYYQLAISPAYFSYFYEKLMETYGSYDNVTGISVGSLGTDLNSDFDEKEPYNREDSKSFVSKALEYFSNQNLEVMVNGGNAYTWQFADHILNAPLDSSRYILASYSVPFLGVVLHGYVNFAGSALNMEGNTAYATLKAIENGAAAYFILSYQNTQILKEDSIYSQYYSVRYDIWFDDVVDIYNDLNSALKDVQNDLIINHEFLSGERVPDADELQNDMSAKYDAVLQYREELARYEEQMKAEGLANAREQIADLTRSATSFITLCLNKYSGADGAGGAVQYYSITNDRFQLMLANYTEADANCKDLRARKEKLAALENPSEEETAELKRVTTSLIAAEKDLSVKRTKLSNSMTKLNKAVLELETSYERLLQVYEAAMEGKLLIEGSSEQIPASVLQEVEENLKLAETIMREQLGTTFAASMEKMSMDTFLNAHVSNLIVDCRGKDNASKTGVVGYVENLFALFTDKNYGVKADELNLLRTLGVNRSLSDAELMAKYGLTDLAEGEGSVEALLQIVREHLGDDVKFDPTMSDEQINEQLTAYFETLLFARIESMLKADSDGEQYLPGLSVITTKTDKTGAVIEDSVAIARLNMALLNITNTIDTVLGNVTSGDSLVFEDHFTEEDMTKLISTVKTSLKGTTYATGGDLEADIRAHAKAYFYKKLMENKQTYLGIPSSVTLNVMSTAYSANDTLGLLYSSLAANYDQVSYGHFAELYQTILNDPAVAAQLAELASSLSAYGDALNEKDLLNAFKQQIASNFVTSKNAINLKFSSPASLYNVISNEVKKLSSGDFKTAVQKTVDAIKNDVAVSVTSFSVDYSAALRELNALFASEAYVKDTANEALKTRLTEFANALKDCITLTEEVEAYLYGAIKGDDDVTVEELNAMVEVVKGMVSGKVDNTTVKEYVYYFYLTYLKNSYVPAYYYNEQLAAADLAIRRATQAKGEKLRSTLSADATANDVYELILRTMVEDHALIDEAVSAISDRWTLKVTGSATSMYDLMMDQYAYLLTYELRDYLIGSTSAVLSPAYATTVVKALTTAVDQRVDSMLRAALDKQDSDAVDYSLTYQKTELGVDMDAVAADLFDVLLAGGYVTEADRAAMLPELTAVFTDAYYEAALGKIGALSAANFSKSLYEKYVELGEGDCGLYQTAEALMEMAKTYVSLLTGLDPDDLIVVEKEDEDTVDNKYLSDDGQIVAVTYGYDKDGDGKYEATKTFILNYNKFAVRVNYPQTNGDATEESVLYTIPAYGYVVVEYDHAN